MTTPDTTPEALRALAERCAIADDIADEAEIEWLCKRAAATLLAIADKMDERIAELERELAEAEREFQMLRRDAHDRS
jgi:hypothetical protein